MNLLTALVAPFIALGAMIGGMFVDKPQLGASEAVPVTIAFFETTLQDAISSSATSFTLTSATDKDGTTLASSTYAFVIDEGSANEEIVIADCTGTACTNALRGVSARTGNTEVSSLKKAHRRGASIKITDAPILMLVSRALRGEAIVNFTPNESRDLVTKDYVDSLALGTAAVSATTLDDGIVELATGTEAASSTATGNSGSPLALHTGISTSTAPTAGSYVVVTEADGNINDGFIDQSMWALLASTTLRMEVFTASGTFSVPQGITYVIVETIGPGGNGGAGGSGGGGVDGGGGGAGGYAKSLVNVSATTSIKVTIGSASDGSVTYFSTYASSTAGSAGAAATTVPGYGGSAGVGHGTLNITGEAGWNGVASWGSGKGGSSKYGSGGLPQWGTSSGNAGTGYGSGGGGGKGSSGQAGGNGTNGLVIIYY